MAVRARSAYSLPVSTASSRDYVWSPKESRFGTSLRGRKQSAKAADSEKRPCSTLTRILHVATVLCYMVTPTTTFRLTAANRKSLDRLADELVCSRSEILRLGMAILARDPAVRAQVRAGNVARAFLKNLRTQYGPAAVLELVEGRDGDDWVLAGEPLDRSVVDVEIHEVDDRYVLHLLDPSTGVAISNAHSWVGDDGRRRVTVSLEHLWVHSDFPTSDEPKTRELVDGRTVVQIDEGDGTFRHIVLDQRGNSHPLESGEIPSAAFRE